jgi:hypothetical protein
MTKYSFVWVIYESKQKISHFLYGKEATRDQNSELSAIKLNWKIITAREIDWNTT